ncbi:MAG TPA: prepilin peptidase [Tepidisphaeraceae bacterium]|nr:prepilin peptidase [Tepidisphaeraceae bacterium]
MDITLSAIEFIPLSPAFFIVVPIFVLALGACVGSFLNVVVWRLPRGESLITPPSHCPKCNNLLKWYDNVPVIGWLMLGGKCRFCKEKISARYPIIEAITGLLFLGYYLMFFVVQIGPIVGVNAEGHILTGARPLSIVTDWPIYFLDMVLLSGLLAASLIDAEQYIIPLEIPWFIAVVALIVHAVFDEPSTPGGLVAQPLPAALAVGAGIGVIISFLLWLTGMLRGSFAEGAPLMEIERAALEKQREPQQAQADQEQPKRSKAALEAMEREGTQAEPEVAIEEKEWTPAQIRAEMRWEMLFLLPALVLGIGAVLLAWKVPGIGRMWDQAASIRWVSALLGSVLGGLFGGFVVWLARILGTVGFGREAMGLGDVHLMVAVGAVLGAGPAIVAFFLAPFFGIVLAVYMMVTGTRREMPLGPYLSLGSAAVMLFYGPIAAYLAPGLAGASQMLHGLVGMM